MSFVFKVFRPKKKKKRARQWLFFIQIPLQGEGGGGRSKHGFLHVKMLTMSGSCPGKNISFLHGERGESSSFKGFVVVIKNRKVVFCSFLQCKCFPFTVELHHTDFVESKFEADIGHCLEFPPRPASLGHFFIPRVTFLSCILKTHLRCQLSCSAGAYPHSSSVFTVPVSWAQLQIWGCLSTWCLSMCVGRQFGGAPILLDSTL